MRWAFSISWQLAGYSFLTVLFVDRFFCGSSIRPPACKRFPAHLVRSPWNALPRSRRRRGPSVGRIFYLGRHPLALLIETCLTMLALEVIIAWIALVVGAWTIWTSAVTMGWLVEVTTAALKRRQSRTSTGLISRYLSKIPSLKDVRHPSDCSRPPTQSI
jgi:hypothetical protein